MYNDGVVVRTVPSRLSRNDRKKESKPEARPDKEKEKERREKEKADRDARRKQQREEARPEEKKRIDCVKISEIFLGKVPEGFVFLPKHRANAY